MRKRKRFFPCKTSQQSGELRFGSLLFFVLGCVLIVSQLAAPIAGILRVLPFFGGALNRAVQVLVYVVIGFAAVIVWFFLLRAVSFIAML